jgi:hypothetical protein
MVDGDSGTMDIEKRSIMVVSARARRKRLSYSRLIRKEVGLIKIKEEGKDRLLPTDWASRDMEQPSWESQPDPAEKGSIQEADEHYEWNVMIEMDTYRHYCWQEPQLQQPSRQPWRAGPKGLAS